MIKIELSNINALGGHAQASHKFLKNFKDELARESRESKENETIQHVLEHVETILSLSEMERTYITSNKISILSLFDSSGRETLAVRIEKFFNEVSRLDLEKMNIQSTQDHKVVEKFLTVFDMLQDFFPDHYDENLARVQKALREKIMAYSSVTDVREYVLSEPKTSITTFEHLSNYANAELNTIAELPDLNVKIEAYQKLKEFTEVLGNLNEVNKSVDIKIPEQIPVAIGCIKCSHTGYQGRMVLSEIITINSEIKELILNNESTVKMILAARKEGMVTIREDGFIKVSRGFTTIEEVYRVTNIVS